jgi:hypothetical protein
MFLFFDYVIFSLNHQATVFFPTKNFVMAPGDRDVLIFVQNDLYLIECDLAVAITMASMMMRTPKVISQKLDAELN